MIQYDKDGVTLFYVDATGKRIAHNFMEGAPYNDMVTVRDAQIQALRENTQSVSNYETALSNAQISVDAGHTVPAPAKPLMKVINDTGEATYAPFDPPLKDLIPAAPGRPAPSSGSIVSASAPPDKQAIMYNMILAMFRKTFPEA
ncbi:MAG: hypothetical protein ABI759_03495 [Candidatus Solibacter sp.]